MNSDLFFMIGLFYIVVNGKIEILFGLAKARLKLSQSRSLDLLSTTTHHTNFWSTSRQARKLIFGGQPNHNLTRYMLHILWKLLKNKFHNNKKYWDGHVEKVCIFQKLLRLKLGFSWLYLFVCLFVSSRNSYFIRSRIMFKTFFILPH